MTGAWQAFAALGAVLEWCDSTEHEATKRAGGQPDDGQEARIEEALDNAADVRKLIHAHFTLDERQLLVSRGYDKGDAALPLNLLAHLEEHWPRRSQVSSSKRRAPPSVGPGRRARRRRARRRRDDAPEPRRALISATGTQWTLRRMSGPGELTLERQIDELPWTRGTVVPEGHYAICRIIGWAIPLLVQQ